MGFFYREINSNFYHVFVADYFVFGWVFSELFDELISRGFFGGLGD
jgi:hypothetical protein